MKTRQTDYKMQNKYFVREYNTQTEVYDRSVFENKTTFNGVVINNKVHIVKYHFDYGTKTRCGQNGNNSTRQKTTNCRSCVKTFPYFQVKKFIDNSINNYY